MQPKLNSQPPTLNKLAYDRKRQRLSRGKIHISAVLLNKSLFSKQTTADFFGFLWNAKSEAPNFHLMQLHAILLLQSRDRWSVQVGLVKKVKQFFEHCEEKKPPQKWSICWKNVDEKDKVNLWAVCSGASCKDSTFLLWWWHEHNSHIEAPHACKTPESLQYDGRLFIPANKAVFLNPPQSYTCSLL